MSLLDAIFQLWSIVDLSATAATVDNSSKPVLSSVWCAEPDTGAAVVGGAEGVRCAGGASLRDACFSGSGGADGANALATGTAGATGRAGAASIRPHAVGARVRTGTATAVVGKGALRIASGLEW